MWIFGYGSLVWKADFPYEEKVIGYIKGYVRRFWQASIDHRGVPGKPGRVVTLVKSDNPEDKVWGVAYRINKALVGKGGSLDHREQKYTERLSIQVFMQDDSQLREEALVFIGTNDPTLQLGPRPIQEMAEQIANSHGPSGPNTEYLFNLAKFLREETPLRDDENEVFQLERAVRCILNNDTVWGVAYKISDDKKKEVISHLDYREKGGYIRHSVFFFPQYNEMDKWQLTIYVGTEDNPFYTGPVDEDNIAEVILSSEGPSGKNIDYLFNLVRAMQEIGVKDNHLLNLYNKVNKLLTS